MQHNNSQVATWTRAWMHCKAKPHMVALHPLWHSIHSSRWRNGLTAGDKLKPWTCRTESLWTSFAWKTVFLNDGSLKSAFQCEALTLEDGLQFLSKHMFL